MSTTAVCGISGSVTGLGATGEISNWTVTLEIDTPEVTSFQSLGNREYLSCLSSATCTFDTFVSCGAIGSHAGVVFTNAKGSITMDVILTDVSITDPVDNAVTYKYSGVSTGPVVVA